MINNQPTLANVSTVILILFHSYFDAHGNYYTKNDPDDIQDNWLREFDWDKV